MSNRNVYIGLGIVAVLLVIFAAYSLMQTASLTNQVSSLNSKLSGQISSLDSRLSAVETIASTKQVKVLFFYDSKCAFCENQLLLQTLPGTGAALSQDGIRMQTIDVAGNYSIAENYGVTRIPAFYSSRDDLAASTPLVTFYNTLFQSNFIQEVAPNGIIARTPLNSIILNSQECRGNVTRVDYFYSDTCPLCKRVMYGNGTISNPTGDVAGESLDEVAKNITISKNAQCVSLHTSDQNYQNLGIAKADSALCIASVGQDAYQQAEQLAQAYSIVSAPTFVVDCKYAFNARTVDKIKTNICMARPDTCK